MSEGEKGKGSARSQMRDDGAPQPRADFGAEPSVAFQDRVRPWMTACFGEAIPFDKVERADRLLEEVFELLQSGGYDPARVLALRDYTWGRPPGAPCHADVLLALANAPIQRSAETKSEACLPGEPSASAIAQDEPNPHPRGGVRL